MTTLDLSRPFGPSGHRFYRILIGYTCAARRRHALLEDDRGCTKIFSILSEHAPHLLDAMPAVLVPCQVPSESHRPRNPLVGHQPSRLE